MLSKSPPHESPQAAEASLVRQFQNTSFSDFANLVEGLGFRLSRVSGSQHTFVHPDVSELVNLQDVGGEAKPYQIRQLMKLVERYNLKLEE
jgi:predicted RNA binding protein YcfA (HicA-like mRNA interferase family)